MTTMQSESGRPNPERIFTTLSAHERAAALAAAIKLDLGAGYSLVELHPLAPTPQTLLLART